MIPKSQQRVIDEELAKLLGKDIVTHKVLIDPDGYYTVNLLAGKEVDVINFPTTENPIYLPAYHYIPEAKILVKDNEMYNIIKKYYDQDSENLKKAVEKQPSYQELLDKAIELENRVAVLEKALNKRGE